MTRYTQGKELEGLFKRLNRLNSRDEVMEELDKLGDVTLVGDTGEFRGRIIE